MKMKNRKSKSVLLIITILSLTLTTFPSVFGASGDIILSTTDVTIASGSTEEIDVSIEVSNLQSVNAFSFILLYDKEAFTVSNLVIEDNDFNEELDVQGNILANKGQVRLVGYSDTLQDVEIPDNMTLARMRFKANRDAEIKSYPLSFKDVEFIIINGSNKQYLNVIEEPGNITIEKRKTSPGGVSNDGLRYVDKDDEKPDDGKPDDEKPDDGKPDDEKPDDGKPDDKIDAEKFTDLAGFEWAYESIDALVKANIISGTTETTYEPSRSITRAEFCKLIAVTFDLKDVDAATSYTDVSSTDWFYEAVIAAANAGIVTGYSEGDFKPNAPITREEMAAMLVRAFRAAGIEVPEGPMTFADADEMGDWAVDLIASLAQMGIVSGRGDNQFVPKGDLTRAESAKVIYAAYEILQTAKAAG